MSQRLRALVVSVGIIATSTVVGAIVAERVARLPPSPPSVAFHGLTIAHRGGSEAGPENTVVAIEAAAATGATAVEVDVFLSADGVPVVIHDDTVDRTTDGSGPVAAFTAAELVALDAAAYRDDFHDVPVPTLDDVIRAVEVELAKARSAS